MSPGRLRLCALQMLVARRPRFASEWSMRTISPRFAGVVPGRVMRHRRFCPLFVMFGWGLPVPGLGEQAPWWEARCFAELARARFFVVGVVLTAGRGLLVAVLAAAIPFFGLVCV